MIPPFFKPIPEGCHCHWYATVMCASCTRRFIELEEWSDGICDWIGYGVLLGELRGEQEEPVDGWTR